MPSLLLKRGMRVRLKQQPWDLPDFILEHWQGNTGWVRQQAWGPEVWLRIDLTQIAIPDASRREPSRHSQTCLKLTTVVSTDVPHLTRVL